MDHARRSTLSREALDALEGLDERTYHRLLGWLCWDSPATVLEGLRALQDGAAERPER